MTIKELEQYLADLKSHPDYNNNAELYLNLSEIQSAGIKSFGILSDKVLYAAFPIRSLLEKGVNLG